MSPRYSVRISSRVVLLTPRRVYKLPVNRRGWLQGKNERKAWESHKKTGLLAPFLYSVGGFVCMVRVLPVYYVAPEMIATVKQRIPALNIDNCDLWNVENWGQYEGRTVLLDYGISKKVASLY